MFLFVHRRASWGHVELGDCLNVDLYAHLQLCSWVSPSSQLDHFSEPKELTLSSQQSYGVPTNGGQSPTTDYWLIRATILTIQNCGRKLDIHLPRIKTDPCNYSATVKAAFPGSKSRHRWVDLWSRLCMIHVCTCVVTSTCDSNKTLVSMRRSPVICVISVW